MNDGSIVHDGHSDSDEVAIFDFVIRIIDNVIVVVDTEQLIDLSFDFLIGRLIGRHLDRNLVIARKRSLGGNGTGHREGERLVLCGNLLEVELRVADEQHVGIIKQRRSLAIHDGLGNAREHHVVATRLALDDLTRGLSLAKARDFVFRELLELLFDVGIDLFRACGHGHDHLLHGIIGLARNICDFQLVSPNVYGTTRVSRDNCPPDRPSCAGKAHRNGE